MLIVDIVFSSTVYSDSYKGGLRFHPSVNLGTMKFLGLNKHLKTHLQVFKLEEQKEEVISIPMEKLI